MQASEEARLEDLEGLCWELLCATAHRYPKAKWNEWRRRYSVAGLDEESAEAEWPHDKPERDDDPYSAYKDDQAKRCPRCGEEKPLGSYYRDASSPDGRQSYCSDCEKEISRMNSQHRAYNRLHEPRYASLIEEGEQRTREVYR